MGKKYELAKLTDILEIPEESMDNFLVDLKAWHGLFHSFNELGKAIGDIKGVDGSIGTEGMTWIDDGKHDAKVTIITKPTHSQRRKADK